MIKTAHNILNTDRPDTHTIQEQTPSIRNCTLSICAINVCGLLSKLNLGIFQEYIQSFDIICISETKNQTIPTHEIYGYKCINHRTGGIYGISILVKGNLHNDIKCLDESQSENVLWISIKHISIIVGAVYIPPQNSENSNVNTFDDITDDVSYIISQYSTGDDILLIGDFNARTGCMSDTYENDIYIQMIIWIVHMK